MNIALLLAASAAALTTSARAQFDEELGSAPKLPGAHTQGPPPPTIGVDRCASPGPITGFGSFPFDNTTATTGAEGQSTTNCIFYNMIAIDQDVWFVWTAPQTTRVQLTTCGNTAVDTKIAVYNGSACPAAGSQALACNDDINGVTPTNNLTSMLFFDAVVSNQYLIQVGTFPAAGGGVGNFSIQPVVPSTTCQFDDGTTENAISIGTQGTLRSTGWLTRAGAVGASTTITSLSTAWGWTGTGSPLPPGLTGNVGVFEDPNDDGNPNDALLLGKASAPMVGQHTDALQTINLSLPVVAQGVYFLAAWTTHTNGFPAPADTLGCGVQPGLSWSVGNAGGDLNTTNLAGNSTPPFQPGANNGQQGNIGYVWVLRGSCSTSAPGLAYCFGDGSGLACPCGNNSAVGNNSGCLSSLASGGKLVASGNPSIASDTVVLSGSQMPNSSALYFQGTTQSGAGAGTLFGDGLRCAGGTVIRLGTTANVGGVSQYPFGGNPSVSVKGLVSVPGTRTYQVWYRNAAAFCTASTFNLSNGWQIAWQS